MQLAVLGLATFYVTYVVTRSSLPPVKWAREGIIDRWPNSSVAYLVNCPWCASFWIAVIIVTIAAQLADVALPGLVVLACAGVTGVLQFAVDAVETMLEP